MPSLKLESRNRYVLALYPNLIFQSAVLAFCVGVGGAALVLGAIKLGLAFILMGLAMSVITSSGYKISRITFDRDANLFEFKTTCFFKKVVVRTKVLSDLQCLVKHYSSGDDVWTIFRFKDEDIKLFCDWYSPKLLLFLKIPYIKEYGHF